MGRKTTNKIAGLDKITEYDIFTNFDYYGLPRPEVLIMDCAKIAFQMRG